MLNKIKIKIRHTLFRWIVLGCTALMIPTVCALINYGINKNLIDNKINQVNRFMLENIKYNIDSKLEDMMNQSKYFLLDEQFTMFSLNIKDERQFNARVLKCYERLRLSHQANSSIEMLLYMPQKGYIIGSATANRSQSIYDSLASQNKILISFEEWKAVLDRDGQNEFLISDMMSYLNGGKENLVFVTPILYSSPEQAGHIFVSASTDFIHRLLENETNRNNTVLIVDNENHIIGQYGASLNMNDVELGDAIGEESFDFRIGRERYIGAGTMSRASGWKYVVCTPQRVYMEEAVRNRNINLLIVVFGVIIGVAVVIISQRRNYRPVQQLVNILPERENGLDEDEFVLVENNLRKLYNENKYMHSSMEDRKAYDREVGLLSIIKGRNLFFKPIGTEELLSTNYQKLQFSFVTIKLDLQEEENTSAIDTDLLVFLINNVIRDIFEEEQCYIKTIDDIYLVYMFLLEDMEEERAKNNWNELCREKFIWLNEFFQSRLELDLTITLGHIFDSFEHVESAYAQILEANEQRYYTEPYGVVEADSLNKIDFSSMGRLHYYSKSFQEAAEAADFKTGQSLSNELFGELESSGRPYNVVLYYVMSIVNDVLMVSRNMVQHEAPKDDVLEDILVRIRAAESLSALQNEYYRFLRLICRAVNEDSRESVQLSENIKTYVKENYTDCNMNISAVAEEIGITPRYMSKIFREQTGINLLSYINDVRIEHAKMLLKTTGRTVEEIAEETGFANVRTFRRNFQKATGITAANYRNW